MGSQILTGSPRRPPSSTQLSQPSRCSNFCFFLLRLPLPPPILTMTVAIRWIVWNMETAGILTPIIAGSFGIATGELDNTMPVGLTCSLTFATMDATMLIRLIAETDQSVEPAMRVAFIKQPPQPPPLQHHAVTKSLNVIYLAQEPTLILLTAGNIGTVTEQAMGTTSSVQMASCSQRDTEVPATMITTYIVGIGLFVMIVTKIVNIILKEYMNDKYMTQ